MIRQVTVPDAPRRKRGRPPDPEIAERRRKELIEAAFEVFAQKGYTSAGIADIAEHLGIGHGTFYRYFESKRDILDHVIDYGVERFSAAVQGDAEPERAESLDDLMEQLHGIAERVYHVLDEEPGLTSIIMLEATSVDEELTYRILGLGDTFAAITAGWLQHGVREGFIRPDLDVDITARGLIALCLPGLVDQLRDQAPPKRRSEMIDGLLDFVRAGLEPR